MLRSTRAAPVEREFGRLKSEWALSPLRVRGLDQVRLHAGPDDPRRARMRTRTRAHRSARGPSLRRTIVIGWPPNRPQSPDGCHVARDTSRPTDSRASSWLCSHSSAWPLSHCSSLDSWTWRSSPTTSTSTRRLPFRHPLLHSLRVIVSMTWTGATSRGYRPMSPWRLGRADRARCSWACPRELFVAYVWRSARE
jgi:hypothetical protein